MVFPAGYTLVTVHGQIDQFPAGGASGTARFTSAPSATLGAADNSIVPRIDRTVSFDTDGSFSIALPATNDPDWAAANWSYEVHIQLGVHDIRGTLQLDYQTTSVQLADLLQVDGTVDTGQTYILLNQRSVAGGIAALDADGDVTDASGAKITGGGGGGAAPGSTVVEETTYGQTATAGTGTPYSRATHSHGTPPAPTADDISDATAIGQALITAANAAAARSAIGAGTSSLALGTTEGTAAEGDDDRITGAQQRSTLTTKGDLYVATASATVARVGVGSDGQVLTADAASAAGVKWDDPAGGGGAAATVVRATLAAGDITAPNDGSTWTPLSGVSLSLPAAAGDNVEFWVIGLLDHNASFNDFYEPVVVASGGGVARFASTGSSSPLAGTATEGDPAQYPDGERFGRWVSGFSFEVEAGDLTGGNVVFGIAHKGPGGGKMQSGDYRTRMWATNHHQ